MLWVLYTIEPVFHRFNSFDDKTFDVYQSLFYKELDTGNIAEATVWKMQVDKDIKASKVEEVMKLVACTEGVFLDPVYTGKSMAGLIDLIKPEAFAPEDTVVFIHSGGFPTLFAYDSEIIGSRLID